MSFSPNDSAIKITKTLEEQIASAASQAEVQAILRRAAVEQKVVVADAFDPNVLLENPAAPPPKKFAASVTMKGPDGQPQKRIFEADNELELERQQAEYFRSIALHEAAPTAEPITQRTTEVADQSAEDAAAVAELRMQMIRGEITPEEFILQSGEMDRYLQRAGIDADSLREVASERSAARFEKSWSDASEEFVQSKAGETWPGGEANMKRLGEILVENNLVDAADKVDALKQAYEFMKSEKLLVEPAENRIADARTPQDLQRALDSFRPTGSSSLFGR